MRKPNKNKMAGVNSRFASVSESIFNGFLSSKNVVEITECVYTKTIILLKSVNSGRIFISISKNNC